jgi:hypothetical protein
MRRGRRFLGDPRYQLEFALLRRCVTFGVDSRIVVADAGARYLVEHRRDLAGAKAVADRAGRAYAFTHPSMQHCP